MAQNMATYMICVTEGNPQLRLDLCAIQGIVIAILADTA